MGNCKFQIFKAYSQIAWAHILNISFMSQNWSNINEALKRHKDMLICKKKIMKKSSKSQSQKSRVKECNVVSDWHMWFIPIWIYGKHLFRLVGIKVWIKKNNFRAKFTRFVNKNNYAHFETKYAKMVWIMFMHWDHFQQVWNVQINMI